MSLHLKALLKQSTEILELKKQIEKERMIAFDYYTRLESERAAHIETRESLRSREAILKEQNDELRKKLESANQSWKFFEDAFNNLAKANWSKIDEGLLEELSNTNDELRQQLHNAEADRDFHANQNRLSLKNYWAVTKRCDRYRLALEMIADPSVEFSKLWIAQEALKDPSSADTREEG